MGNIYRELTKTEKIPAYTVSSSIPTKYQKVVITNQEKKGFSSKAKRFPSQVCLNENPGPGSYGCISSAEVKSPSFSKKGTTGFVASKAARASSNPQRSIPGPNAYNLPSSFTNKYDFNSGVSRVFRLPVAVQLDGPKHKTPAPNQYDVSCSSRERLSSVVGTAAFLSKTGRNTFYPNKNVPSPCHYEVNNMVIQHGSKAVLSPFKSKTQRIPAPVDNHVPGPGAYSPHQTPAPVKRTILPRGYYLAISAPPLIVPKGPPLPGPGQYDIGDYKCLSKHLMPTAAFASRTERIPRISRGNMSPGPGFYDPQILPKQSFFYNDSRVWIPV
ncbi:O(6)-methylguanine-induced apoptosis 2 isoform X1 [Micropterus salmoides]|uniref:O(6)-methylguanine-induced apoptosis 2 isoform X1 n=1 Tax=Micropterus salmoides TaxID=27706 RepID=UPI0018EE40DC|nr:O(6)-methylguanine-induced apoptosis 2 isoform X1 [Micropterus salmoides]XP_038583906.1 O(6)-methylguanine-induced apoptosis 2 isoform X1 [Micropterus salmoides]XP_038583907.1 O(6)-methylguanine-induced apoptosis 2 isoform X1 [Micropterus salmoides]